MEFANQNILITGAADGLGLAVSKAFAKQKANLFLIDVNYKKLIQNNISMTPQARSFCLLRLPRMPELKNVWLLVIFEREILY